MNQTIDTAQMYPQIQTIHTAFDDLRGFYKENLQVPMDDVTISHINAIVKSLQDHTKWGIIMMGNVGAGKTTLMRVLVDYYFRNVYHSNKAYPVIFRTAKEIAKTAINGGNYNEYCNVLAIDDLGEEAKEVMSYGNVITPLVDIIESRYDSRKMTFFTTNLDANGIKEKYGARVADRLKQMCNIVSFTNDSYR
jgi:DNA replication protein DnaC